MMQTRSGPKPSKPRAVREFAEAEGPSSEQKRSVRDAIRKLTFGPAAETRQGDDAGRRTRRREAVGGGDAEE